MVVEKLSPIILFVYNRPRHTLQTINALKKNELASESILYIFSDAAKKSKDIENVEKVREIIKEVDGFKEVVPIMASSNIGCADSIIKGISYVMERHDDAIIVEDDIVTAPNFLKFMNEALFKYKNDKRIYSVSGYNVPMDVPESYSEDVFLVFRYSSWGWGTWKDRWSQADWNVMGWEKVFNDKAANKKFRRGGDDLPYILKAQMKGTIDAWDIRWYYSHFEKDRFTLFPVTSLVENIGFDGTGIHCGQAESAIHRPVLKKQTYIDLPDTVEFNQHVNNVFTAYYKYGVKDKVRRFLKELLRYKINK